MYKRQLFEGSDWQTGAYFEKRGYASDKWRELAETVAAQGMRNAYLLAVAPTSSTSILSGTSAGIDPIMKKFFLEEKKGSMLPRVAPELSMDTWWYYKAAHLIDQSLSLIHIFVEKGWKGFEFGDHYDKMGIRSSAVEEERSEEHTSELQSRETISYAVFCLKKKMNRT